MYFIITKESILEPLQQIVNVIEKRQTMPILGNVLMTINRDKLILTGTDLEIQIVAHLTIDTEHELKITIPARKFFDICRALPDKAEIKIEYTEDKAKIYSGRSRFLLSTLDADDYPKFSEEESKYRFLINAGRFKNSLNKTIFCMGNQDVRYYLNGLLVETNNNKLKLVASDGHRLSVYEGSVDLEDEINSRIILPRKGVIELSRLLDDPDADLEFECCNNNIRILYKNLVFSAKLIDATYPEFSKIFHQEFNPPMIINTQILKDALTRVAILSNDKIKGVNFDINSNLLKLSTHNPEQEEAEEELIVDYEGPSLSISFNVQYLLEAVSNLGSEISELTIAMNGSCCFIVEPGNAQYRFIVMPMVI